MYTYIYIYLQIFCLQIQTSALEVHELPAAHGQVQSPGLDEGGRPDDWIVDSWTRRFLDGPGMSNSKDMLIYDM